MPRDATLDLARLDRAVLHGVHGNGAHFAKVRAAKTDFGESELCHADLSDGRFWQASFVRADLRDAVAKGADFRNAYFKCADLRGALLEDADFRGASLEDVDLRDANLFGANLYEQVLRTANLSQANLGRCDLEFAE